MSSPGSSLLKVEVIDARNDRRLAWLALVATPIAVSMSALSAGPGVALAWYVLFTFLTVTFGAVALWREGVFGGQRRLRTMALLADGSWSLTDARGVHRMRLLPGSRVGRGWVWLRWSPASRRAGLHARSMLLTGGDLSAADMRRLQLYLRWHRPAERALRGRRGVLAAPEGV